MATLKTTVVEVDACRVPVATAADRRDSSVLWYALSLRRRVFLSSFKGNCIDGCENGVLLRAVLKKVKGHVSDMVSLLLCLFLFRHPASYGFGQIWVFAVSCWYTLQCGRTEMLIKTSTTNPVMLDILWYVSKMSAHCH